MRRRDFITLSAAFAAAMSGCRSRDERIIPLVEPEEHFTPGEASYYSTAYRFKNFACGAIVKTIDGRPVKIEGNPNHLVNQGSSSLQMQTELFSLYNPARFRKPRVSNEFFSVEKTLELLFLRIEAVMKSGKKTYAVIDEHCSPSLNSLISLISAEGSLIEFLKLPAYGSSNFAKANNDIFGIDAELVPDVSKSDYVLTLGADILGADLCSLYHTSRLSQRKRDKAKREFNLTAIESAPSLTGRNANLRISAKNSEFADIATALFCSIYEKVCPKGLEEVYKAIDKSNLIRFSQLEKITGDLIANIGRSAVIAGKSADYTVCTLVNCINLALSANGETRIFDPCRALPFSGDSSQEIINFQKSIEREEIGCVIFIENNAVYYFKDLFDKIISKESVLSVISASIYETETSKAAMIDLPLSHQFESWSDAVSIDGTYSICQPLIEPLNENSISSEDLLLELSKRIFGKNFEFGSFYDFVKGSGSSPVKTDTEWLETLKTGVFPVKIKTVKEAVNSKRIEHQAVVAHKLRNYYNSEKVSSESFILLPLHDGRLYDGSLAENMLLQEIPCQISGIGWTAIGFVSAGTAQKLELKPFDAVLISRNGKTSEIPVIISDEMPNGVIAAPLGYGRHCKDLKYFGDNLYDLLTLEERISGKTYFATKLVKSGSAPHYLQNAKEFDAKKKRMGSALSPEIRFSDFNSHEFSFESNNPPLQRRWTMGIDLELCTSCGTCIAACQAENNIPVVGPEESLKQRDLHWIKIHKQSNSEFGDKKARHLPVMCQHCDDAPCEKVCPVYATSQSPEGLNEMTYNRCIGSRYCMVNCPYKVRKFNFFDYRKKSGEPLTLMLNPEVTVRSRGVAEKCTFCVQRIAKAKYAAIDSGLTEKSVIEVTPACAQACPAGAIIFGDGKNPQSQISKTLKGKKGYALLGHLNTKPSVVYYNAKDDGDE